MCGACIPKKLEGAKKASVGELEAKLKADQAAAGDKAAGKALRKKADEAKKAVEAAHKTEVAKPKADGKRVLETNKAQAQTESTVWLQAAEEAKRARLKVIAETRKARLALVKEANAEETKQASVCV